MASFDLPAFLAALDAARRTRDLTWRQVAEQSGTTQSLYTRMNKGDGRSPDVHNLVAMAAWAGLRLDDYIVTAAQVHRSAREQVIALILGDAGLEHSHRKFLINTIAMFYDIAADPTGWPAAHDGPPRDSPPTAEPLES